MTPRIVHVLPLPEYRLSVSFDNGNEIIYDVMKIIEERGR